MRTSTTHEGGNISSSFENYFLHALKIRRLLKQEMDVIMSQVDLLLTLTTPNIPPLLSEIQALGTTESYLEDFYTVFASLIGAPALSLPVEHMGAKDMPYSIQLMTQHGSDDLLIQVASILKQSSDGLMETAAAHL
jgi:aspartyl-tRNA(Asn)/glutamyl-tRNA(Gln) amidotransferase subunit A